MSFGLKQFLLACLVSAVGFAAIANADLPLVAELFDLFVPITIILIGYGAWVTVGEARAVRIGFVAWSAGYYLLSRWFNIAFNLVTGRVLRMLQEPLKPMRVKGYVGALYVEDEWFERFTLVGHCVFTLLFGLVGAWVTVYFYRKRQRMLQAVK